jgi:hypothetical protein
VIGAFAVAAIFWFFGADLWHSILLGVVLTTMALVVSTRRSVFDHGDTNWRGSDVRNREGARNDVDQLSWSLRTRYGRVGDTALRRVQRLAGLRMARFGLDLREPLDRGAIERLIGHRTYVVLTRNSRRPPTMRSLLQCLDALDSLIASRSTTSSGSSTFNMASRTRAR